ncbi:basic proline-rich protein-like [Choloepus didactylus]|uniref:basic proline-rich protein-like n=1 Tax=Choloepus didactylus TaxID=27675 RepID=UPI00189E081A|nr:basic proline-rich protein-like [Choloepus didactylus]
MLPPRPPSPVLTHAPSPAPTHAPQSRAYTQHAPPARAGPHWHPRPRSPRSAPRASALPGRENKSETACGKAGQGPARGCASSSSPHPAPRPAGPWALRPLQPPPDFWHNHRPPAGGPVPRAARRRRAWASQVSSCHWPPPPTSSANLALVQGPKDPAQPADPPLERRAPAATCLHLPGLGSQESRPGVRLPGPLLTSRVALAHCGTTSLSVLTGKMSTTVDSAGRTEGGDKGSDVSRPHPLQSQQELPARPRVGSAVQAAEGPRAATRSLRSPAPTLPAKPRPSPRSPAPAEPLPRGPASAPSQGPAASPERQVRAQRAGPRGAGDRPPTVWPPSGRRAPRPAVPASGEPQARAGSAPEPRERPRRPPPPHEPCAASGRPADRRAGVRPGRAARLGPVRAPGVGGEAAAVADRSRVGGGENRGPSRPRAGPETLSRLRAGSRGPRGLHPPRPHACFVPPQALRSPPSPTRLRTPLFPAYPSGSAPGLRPRAAGCGRDWRALPFGEGSPHLGLSSDSGGASGAFGIGREQPLGQPAAAGCRLAPGVSSWALQPRAEAADPGDPVLRVRASGGACGRPGSVTPPR